MSTATHADEPKLRNPELPTKAEIEAQLRLVLSSPVFHGSKRCQQFLEYVCSKSLAGDMGSLKERSIAIDVFGRHPDTAGHGEDTIVRVGAREVRKRLAQYYVTSEGAATPVVIELPSGSYAPEFHYGSGAKSPVKPVAPVDIVVPPAEPSVVPVPADTPRAVESPVRRWRVVLSVAAGVLLFAAVVAYARWTTADPRVAAYERFWSPVFHSTEPLLIGVGHPLVYQPSSRASALNAQRHAPPPFPVQRPLDLPPGELNGSDIVPVFNQFVGFGDMVAANEVSQMLARSVPFADLRQSQAYLIGSVSNHWTMELGQNWRFRFGWSATPDRHPEFVDTLPGSHREWAIPSQDDGSTPEDYSLICRIRNSPTGQLLIVSAGLKQFGTEAAGRILTDPIALGTILNKLPAGWEDKNVEVVLHMKVIGNTPAQPEVVASHVW
jgi:hypothetical protein